MEQKMRSIGRKMSILMGVTLSFCLSLVGQLSSGHFAVPGFLLSFAVSLVISLIIGFFVPMGRINASVEQKHGKGIKSHLIESCISDLIYTPIITVVMIVMNYMIATSHGAEIPFVPMLVKGLIVSLIVGYVLIFVLMPLFLKLLLPKGGPGAEGPGPQ
jgi:hypothetical protein